MSKTNPLTLRLILGDQLNRQHSWFDTTAENITYCYFETKSETTYVKHHVQKVVGYFLSMRAFAKELKDQGHQVIYHQLGDQPELVSISDHVSHLLGKHDFERFEYQLPDEYRLDKELEGFCESLEIPTEVYETEHFLSGRNEVAQIFAGKKTYLMETFYRQMRKRYGLLIEANEEPVGGQWNFDHDNRGKLPKGIEIPATLRFEHDASAILELLEKEAIPVMGRMKDKHFTYPIDRKESLMALRDFCDHRLVDFGTYQDALTVNDELLFHSRLSFALNTKMIAPLEVAQAAIKAWRDRPEVISINQVEGFIRQIIGWREYMRGVYWAQMPSFGEKNFFDHQARLPEWYWTGEVKMKCLDQAVNESLDNAYAHHIQRLMVTGNFALLLGVNPDEVDAWYLGVYIDAIEWVEITNTRGMSQWADGGLVATKPYISSANYIHKQGDYCKNCSYDNKARVGENACPFNSLYWDFLARHEDSLRSNFRMSMIYRVWDRFADDQKEAILERAEWVKEHVEEL